MYRKPWASFVLAVAWAALVADLALAQNKQDRPTNSGGRPWMVVKLTTNILDDHKEVMADFNSKAAAEEYAASLNAATKSGDPFFFQVEQRNRGQSQPEPAPEVVSRPKPSAPPILTPIVKLPSVDPGPYQSSKPKYPADDPRNTKGAYNNPLLKDKPTKESVVGTWSYSDGQVSMKMIFFKDGTGRSTASWGIDQSFVWTLDGDKVSTRVRADRRWRPDGWGPPYEYIIRGNKMTYDKTTYVKEK
jgi:hypothetical protein